MLVEDPQEAYVMLASPRGNRLYTPCEWVTGCPFKKLFNPFASLFKARKCPAFGLEIKMTHAEAIEWWERQLDKKIIK